MEYREFATRILAADTIEEKLLTPDTLTDCDPGTAVLWETPSRPAGMEFRVRTREEKLPPFQEHGDVDKRAVCLHRFAGHELLAVEIMAYAVLAFPDAPTPFRRGLMKTLVDEQRHVQLYIDRMSKLGLQFGDFPLYKHFWSHVKYLRDPITYVSTMNLTFEQANLDFASMYGDSFRRHGDLESAALMDTILLDEIAHVGFGVRWLRKLKDPNQSEWEAFTASQTELLQPRRARGFLLHEEPRRRAGLSAEWIESMRSC